MLDVHLSAVADMELYTDASYSHGLAHTTVELGSVVTDSHTRRLKSGKSIAWQELFAVVIACLTWGKHRSGKRVYSIVTIRS